MATLILLDEVLMYARQRVAQEKGWLIKLQAFFQALTQAAVKTDRCAVVASLLASKLDRMDTLGMEITNALKDVFGRQQEEPVEPVMKEDVAEVLRRRFFTTESLKDKEALRPHAMTAFKGIVAHDEAIKKQGPDQTVRTWWRSRPDDDALKDTDTEVVLSTSAELAEIPTAQLRKGVLPGLWETKTELPLSEVKTHFAGGKVVQVDRGGYFEGQQVPKASVEVVSAAVEKAVADGDLWLVSGPTSLFRESIPAGVLTDASLLLPPPEPIVAAAILEGNIPAAWKDNKATVAGMLSQLSDKTFRGAIATAYRDELPFGSDISPEDIFRLVPVAVAKGDKEAVKKARKLARVEREDIERIWRSEILSELPNSWEEFVQTVGSSKLDVESNCPFASGIPAG